MGAKSFWIPLGDEARGFYGLWQNGMKMLSYPKVTSVLQLGHGLADVLYQCLTRMVRVLIHKMHTM